MSQRRIKKDLLKSSGQQSNSHRIKRYKIKAVVKRVKKNVKKRRAS